MTTSNNSISEEGDNNLYSATANVHAQASVLYQKVYRTLLGLEEPNEKSSTTTITTTDAADGSSSSRSANNNNNNSTKNIRTQNRLRKNQQINY